MRQTSPAALGSQQQCDIFREISHLFRAFAVADRAGPGLDCGSGLVRATA
jgi:hypothetical protein